MKIRGAATSPAQGAVGPTATPPRATAPHGGSGVEPFGRREKRLGNAPPERKFLMGTFAARQSVSWPQLGE